MKHRRAVTLLFFVFVGSIDRSASAQAPAESQVTLFNETILLEPTVLEGDQDWSMDTRAQLPADGQATAPADPLPGTWLPLTSGTASDLAAVAQIDTEAWIAGADSTLLHTSDGNWVSCAAGIPTPSSLHSIDFSNAVSGWTNGAGFGGAFLARTTDGCSWTPWNVPGDYDLFRIDAVSPLVVWGSGIYFCTPGPFCSTVFRFTYGSTLTMETVLTGDEGWPGGIFMLDAAQGWMLDSGIIKITVGTSWPPTLVRQTNLPVAAIAPVDSGTAYAVGSAGTILKTVDGGANWVAQTSGTTADLRSIFCLNATTCLTVGAGGTVLRTEDGANWQAEASGSTALLNDIIMDSGRALAVGSGGVVLKRECTYLIEPGSAAPSAAGGSATVVVTTGVGCAWTAVSNSTWITVTDGSSGNASGTVSYSVDVNLAGPRTGTITIAGHTFTVNQSAAACSYSIDPTSVAVPAAGASGTVAVTTDSWCSWTAVSNDAWITVTGGSSGTGNGTVDYSVAVNPAGARTGTVTIAGQTLTVDQSASACSYSVDPTSVAVPAAGASGTVAVTTGSWCGWTAVSNDTWITVTGGSSGTGNGTVSYSVAVNPAGARSGTVTIAGQTFTVDQSAAACSYSIDPTSLAAPPEGATGSVTITTDSWCSWTAASNDSWITVTGGSSGTGNGSTDYSVARNSGPARTGTCTIAGETFTVNQTETLLSPAGLVLTPLGQGVLKLGDTVEVQPSWTNAQATATPDLTGTASAGNGGTIVDGAAGYGVVAAGATASCTATSDCYSLTASGPRPANHWDITVDETLSEPASHQWLLHVGDSFTDVPRTSGYFRFVETLIHKGVTGGCTATTYCPTTSATRGQMAVFALVGKEGSSYSPPLCGTTPMFTDVPVTSPLCKWIEELVRRGIAGGCTATTYCPGTAVTRAQMPIFMLKTLDPSISPPACGTPVFADVPAASPYCRWIEELARRGVVGGCGGGNYCPSSPVTRQQMAVFISSSFGLTLYGP